MAENFRELEKKLSPARRKRIAARVKELKAEMKKADIASLDDEVASAGIKDLCGIQICENCEGDVDPSSDNCIVQDTITGRENTEEEKLYFHKICPLPKNS